MNAFQDTYRDKVVLVTGHTGFKGSWLSIWLNQLGARVVGLSIDIPTTPCNFEVSKLGGVVDDRRADVRHLDAVRDVLLATKPDFIFHLAAQPLVRASYEDPLGTFVVNAIGTAHILQALRDLEKAVSAVMCSPARYHQ